MPDKIRWALIGCGDIAEKATAPAINADPNSVLHAVVRRSREKVQDFASRHKSRTHHCRIEDALRDPEVDAVYVATPVALHKEQTIAACNAGKHVLCEKPMAMNAAECAEMVRAARANGVTLGVSYYRRLYPKVIRVKELLAQGVIGKPQVVRIDLRGWYAPAPNDPKNWRVRKAESGGGVLMDVGSHRLDLLVHFFGLPESVAGRAQTLAHSCKGDARKGDARPDAVKTCVPLSCAPFDVDDAAMGMMNYADGLTAWTCFLWSSKTSLDEFDIVGSDGRITMLPLDSPNLTLTVGSKTTEEKWPPPSNRHEPLIKDFTQALLQKRSPIVSGSEGRKTSLIMDAVYQSSATGSVGRVSE